MKENTPPEILLPPRLLKPATQTREKKRSQPKKPAKSSPPLLGRGKRHFLKRKTRDKRADALRKIGLSAADLEDLPSITHILKHAEGGIRQVLCALRSYDDPIAKAFLKQYRSITADELNRLEIEEIALAAGISPLDLLAAATKALFLENQTISAIIASTSHPRVVEETVRQAHTPGGHRDREMMHIATGFLPSPKGAVFISNRIQVANFAPKKEEASEDAPDLPDMDRDVLDMDEFEKKMLAK